MVRWTIEEMRREHIAQIMKIERKSFITPWTKEMFLYEITAPFSFHFVATTVDDSGDDRVVCYIIFWILMEEVHILNLATHPDLRNQGIAHSLLLFALDFSYRKGGILYLLEVRRGNQAALNLYRKVGFVAWRVRKHYYADTGEDALIMRLFYGDRIYERQGDGQFRLP